MHPLRASPARRCRTVHCCFLLVWSNSSSSCRPTCPPTWCTVFNQAPLIPCIRACTIILPYARTLAVGIMAQGGLGRRPYRLHVNTKQLPRGGTAAGAATNCSQHQTARAQLAVLRTRLSSMRHNGQWHAAVDAFRLLVGGTTFAVRSGHAFPRVDFMHYKMGGSQPQQTKTSLHESSASQKAARALLRA